MIKKTATDTIECGPSDNLEELNSRLNELIGEPFRFLRVSYGDELTIHCGQLRPYNSPKLDGLEKGSYIIGSRATHWVIKTPLYTISSNLNSYTPRQGGFNELPNKAFEELPLVAKESTVIDAHAFFVRRENHSSTGLRLGFSDDSSLVLIPKPTHQREEQDEVPDWEVFMRDGSVLQAGPGTAWLVTKAYGRP